MTFDAYHKWLGIPKDQRPPTHYQLLGLAHGESDPEVIEEAAIRQMSHLRAYQIGAYSAECTRLLNEVAKARATLLDPAKRKQYELQVAASQSTAVTAQAPAGIVSPFDQLDSANEKANLVSVKRTQKSGAALWIGIGAAVVLAIATAIGVAVVLNKGDDKSNIAHKQHEEKPKPKPPPVEEKPKPIEEKPKPPEEKPREEKKAPIEAPMPATSFVEIKPGEVYRNARDSNFIRFTPDGRHILFQHPRGVSVWNVDENKEVRVLSAPANMSVLSSAVSPNSKYAAVYTPMREALIWDMETGATVRSIREPHTISTLAFSPDNRALAVASGLGKQNNSVRLWDIVTGNLVKKFDGFALPPAMMALDQSTLYAVDPLRTLYRCNLETGQIDSRKQLNSFSPFVRFSPDVKQMAFLKSGRIVVWDLQDDKELRGADLPADARPYANGLHVTADSRMAVVALTNPHHLLVFDLLKGVPIKTLEGHEKAIRAASLAPDGTRAFSIDQDKMLRVWKLDDAAAQVAALKPETKPETKPEVKPETKTETKFDAKLDPKFIPEWESIKCPSYSALAITPDGKKAVTAGPGLDVWDLTTGNLVKKLHGGAGDSAIGSVALSPDGSHVLAISGDNLVRLWEVATGRMVRSHIYGATRPNCVAWAPNGQYAAVGGKYLYLIDPESLTTKHTVTSSKEGDVLCVAFYRDGLQIVFGLEGGAVRAVPVTGSGARTVYSHVNGTSVFDVVMTGNLVISGGVDKLLYVWDTAKGRGDRFDPKTIVRAVATSPKGTYALSAGEDKKIRFWHIRTGRMLQAYSGHDATVRAVAFSPNGQFFLSTSEDGTLRAWKLPKDVGVK